MADNDIHEIKILKNYLRNLLYRMHYMGKTILDVGGVQHILKNFYLQISRSC